MRKFKRVNNKQFGIYMLIFALIITMAGITGYKQIISINNQNLYESVNNVNILKELRKQYIVKGIEDNFDKQQFIISAYDLSIKSCGKSRGSKGYGITKDGTNLQNQSWYTAKVISADPKLISLGTKVELKFIDANYKKYDGVYVCKDTGFAIRGNKIDLFLGDFNSQKQSKEAINFGTTQAVVTIISD
jgi:3D (Asp-Asp-Asp) domain-containing protein